MDHFFSSRLLLLVAVASALATCISADADLDLKRRIERLRGDDHRLVRYDATQDTVDHQATECEEATLKSALRLLLQKNNVVSIPTKSLVAEYVTFCVTDNPGNRHVFSQIDGGNIYQATVELLLQTQNLEASANAAHLIYITAYNHKANLDGYFDDKSNTVHALAKVLQRPLKEEDSTQLDHDASSETASDEDSALAVQHMWAMAAVQNLAASYCNDNVYCHWYWPGAADAGDPHAGKTHVVLDSQHNEVHADGTRFRQAFRDIDDGAVLFALIDTVCQMGPVVGAQDEVHNPFPGDFAKSGTHDHHYNILAWAAAGALKNLALDPSVRPLLEEALPCACHLQHSEDWLEADKADSFLAYMRPADPCYFFPVDHFGNENDDEEDLNTQRKRQLEHDHDEVEEDYAPEGDVLCWDSFFINEEGSACGDFSSAADEGCDTKDVSTGVSAREACCECGGGNQEDDYDDGHGDEF